MFKSKHGKIIALGLFIAVFSLMMIFWLFTYNFFFQIGDENVNAPLNVVVLDVGNQTNISAAMTTHLAALPGQYRNTNLYGDFYFIVFFGAFIITSFIVAAKSRKEPPFSLFGTLTMGIMLYFLVISYVETIRIWLIDNLIVGVLQLDLTETFIINAYLQDLVVINFTILLLLIVINQMDFSFVKNSGGRIEA